MKEARKCLIGILIGTATDKRDFEKSSKDNETKSE